MERGSSSYAPGTSSPPPYEQGSVMVKGSSSYASGTFLPPPYEQLPRYEQDEYSNDAIRGSLKKRFDTADPLSSKHSIYRVPERLRSVKEAAYTPMLVSIGPHHHGNEKFESMENDKLRYLYILLGRPRIKLESYVEVVMDLERDARNSYAESLSYTRKEFVEMMLLDGCFIVMLMIQYSDRTFIAEGDPIFKNHWIFSAIHRDLLLLENQLPLFILKKLFHLIVESMPTDKTFIQVIMHFLAYYPMITNNLSDDINNESEHLVDMALKNFIYSPLPPVSLDISNNHHKDLFFIPCATELQQVGIKFFTGRLNNLEISFDGNRLTLPSLVVDHRTESHLRNLLAFEQSHSSSPISHPGNPAENNGESTTILSDYVTVMDCLINTSEDVEVLRDGGITSNHLGDDEEVAQLFNKLCNGIVTRSNKFHYSHIFKDVNEYHKVEWNRAKSRLKREYFNSPWAKISFCAALFLLICTAIQAYSSLKSLFPHGHL